jgi:hypothetical protein
MAARQPAWVRRSETSARETQIMPARPTPPGRLYGAPPAGLAAGLTILLPILAFALLVMGHLIAAAAVGVVSIALAITFAPETREALRRLGGSAAALGRKAEHWGRVTWFALATWSRAAVRVARLRLSRRKLEGELHDRIFELGSAAYEGDDAGAGVARSLAEQAAAAIAQSDSEEARALHETRERIAETRRGR